MNEQAPPPWWEDPQRPAPATLAEVLAEQLAFLRVSLRGWRRQRAGRSGRPALRGPAHPPAPSAPGQATMVGQAPQAPAPAQAVQAPAPALEDSPARAWLPPELAEQPLAHSREPSQADRGPERWLPPEIRDGQRGRGA